MSRKFLHMCVHSFLCDVHAQKGSHIVLQGHPQLPQTKHSIPVALHGLPSIFIRICGCFHACMHVKLFSQVLVPLASVIMRGKVDSMQNPCQKHSSGFIQVL